MGVKMTLFILILLPSTAWAQEVPGEGTHGSLDTVELRAWAVFGRVADMKGDPVGGADVRVDVGVGMGSVRSLKTTLQGEFRTVFSLSAEQSKRLHVVVAANKPGFAPATETADFGSTDTSRGIELVLRNLTENPDQVSMATLVATLAPRLRQDAAKGSGPEADRKEKDFVRGCVELIDHNNAARAAPLLSRGVEWAPSCVECRLLLTLALLEAGSWTSANRQLDEATKLNDVSTLKRPEPALIAGVLEAWRGEASASADSLRKALAIDPNHALTLQEMGRVLLTLDDWEAADRYLERAIRAGASDEARLLRVRALLEEGDNAEAGHEMEQYTANREVKTLPPEARTLYLRVKDRLSLQPSYAQAQSVLTESPQDLMKAMPELQGIRMASTQDELKGVLEKVGAGVESFFRNFPNTVSLEQVHQERLGKDGKVAHALDQDFQFLLLARTEKWGLGVEEHRATMQGERATIGGYDQGLMLTAGFASVSLIFYPGYQNGAGFRYLGRQSVDGKDLHVIAFAQNPRTARTEERFSTDQGSALILIQGLAWIDPATFQIVRLRTDLLAPQSKVRLQKQTTEIHFKEVSFKEVAAALWLPEKVSVTVDWRGRVYRNSHRYSDYKLFNVETKEERKTPLLPPPPDQHK